MAQSHRPPAHARPARSVWPWGSQISRRPREGMPSRTCGAAVPCMHPFTTNASDFAHRTVRCLWRGDPPAVPRTCIGALVRIPWTASVFWSRQLRKDGRTRHSAAQPRCPPLPPPNSFPRLGLLLPPPRAAANGCGQCHAVTVMAGRRGCGAWRPDDPPPQSEGIVERGAAHPSAPSAPVHATIPPPPPPNRPFHALPPTQPPGRRLACLAALQGGSGVRGAQTTRGPATLWLRWRRRRQWLLERSQRRGPSPPSFPTPPPLPAAAGLWRPPTRVASLRGERRCPHAPQWLPRAGARPPSPRTCCPRAGGSRGAG